MMEKDLLMNNKEQNYGDDPKNVRDSEHYKDEYVHGFVDKWDELIDWDARSKGEGDFFIRELKKRNKTRILDAATGTGYHSIQLIRNGFEVWSADGSANMLVKAFENGKRKGHVLKTVETDWRWLSRDVHNKFDAIICLGNSFTHLFDEKDRRKTLAEFYAALKHDGILILDQRNYDAILDNGFSSRHTYYYAGDSVKAEPEYWDDGLIRFRYQYPDNSVYNLNMFPLRKEYTRKLLFEAGFQNVESFGDFEETYQTENPDFFIHIAEKEYQKE